MSGRNGTEPVRPCPTTAMGIGPCATKLPETPELTASWHCDLSKWQGGKCDV